MSWPRSATGECGGKDARTRTADWKARRIAWRGGLGSQGRLRLGENLSALLVVFLRRDLIRPVLAQQLLEPLLFVRGDSRGRALERRE